MDNHRDSADFSSDQGQLRRAEQFSGLAVLGLALGVSILSLLMGEPAIPLWTWIGILVAWCTAVIMCNYPEASRRGRLISYGCAVLTAWILVLTGSTNDLLMIVLVAVAAIGSQLLAIRWVMVLSAMNCVLIFWIQFDRSPDNLVVALGVSVFYVFIHAATISGVYAFLREARLRDRETRLRAELEEKNLKLEAASVLLEDSVVATERLRISRELHDVLGHHLTVLNLDLEVAKLHSTEANREQIDHASGVAKDVLSDLRSTVGELREDTPGDLRINLQRLADAVSSLEIHVDVDAEIQTDEETTATLIRTAQEIITNTLKHAEATELLLKVTADQGTVILTGANDGAAPEHITPGLGLTGLRERVELLGGRLSISSSPEFTVKAQLPVTQQRQVQQ